MVYVLRNAEGAVCAVFRGKQPGIAEEYLPEDNAEIVSYLAPPVPPISDRQFSQQLAIVGTISEAEAIGWAARGDLPGVMETAIGQLPEGDQFAARMLLSSATTYEFEHPLGAVLGGLLGFSEAQRRSLWLAAAKL